MGSLFNFPETIMHVEDGSGFQKYQQAALLVKIQKENTAAHLTYDKPTEHPEHGTCQMKIYRAIGNDSGLKVRMTQELLAKYEPKVGMWAGDRIEYWKNDKLIAVEHG